MIVNRNLLSGSNLFSISVPNSGTPLGDTYARFRLSSTGNLGPTGPAIDGEVEDYRIRIVDTVVGTSPFQNAQNPADVNDNGAVSIADILLVINNIRNFGVRDLTITDPGVTPGVAPFVDVTGDTRLDISDILAVVSALRNQSASPEGESAVTVVSTLDPLGVAALNTPLSDATSLNTATLAPAGSTGVDQNGSGGADTLPAAPSHSDSAVALKPVRQELMLSAASFKTYEFESALDDIVDDVAGNWGDDAQATFNDAELLLEDAEIAVIRRAARRGA